MLIAEIGINHNGDLSLAKKMILMSKYAGVDVVKFQKRTLETVIPKDEWDAPKETPWGKMRYIDYKRRLEFEKPEYDEIDRYCRSLDIPWTASVWDENSLHFLLTYDIPFVKIPSACITDLALLDQANSSGKDIILSTGMSSLDEVTKAVEMFDRPISILHCNSSYPSPPEEANLATIGFLKRLFPKHTIGYSGHEIGIYTSVYAAVLGAEIIERHVTIDKSMWGADHSSSIDMVELIELSAVLSKIPAIKGTEVVECFPSEESSRLKLRRFQNK